MTKRKASVALETGDESDQSSTQDNNSNSTSATNATSVIGQAVQNGAIISDNNGDKLSDDNNSSNQHKGKKERADNWSSAEIQVLHRGIETRRDVFYGPPNQATKKNRELAWDAITKEVNNVSTTPRTVNQVMKKFKNEKCRAKRKFVDSDKDNQIVLDGANGVSNNTTISNNNSNLNTQNHASNSEPHQTQHQNHHLAANESMSSQQSSINVVKLAPQNVTKTMIDLPGHVQQLQMPTDDMVLIVPPDMDGLLSGMNIISDGNGHHHFQKCSNNNLGNQQHNPSHGQAHTIQTLNTGQSLVNGAMSNSMMARTIPAGSMCSLVYSTGTDSCSDQHLATSLSGTNTLTANQIGLNAQNLMHHRSPVEPSHQQQIQHHHQIHQPQQAHPQQQQQQQPQHQQQQQSQHPHQTNQHQQHQLSHNHLTQASTISSSGGIAVESQLKNLLFNLLLKDGQHFGPVVSANQDSSKQRNDILAIIAGSLNKIEGHLSKISRVASSLMSQNTNSSLSISATTLSSSGAMGNNDSNGVSITGTGNASTAINQSGSEG